MSDETSDEEFEDEEFASDVRGRVAALPRPEGGFRRPNGVEYVPRMIGGMQDLAFIRHCQQAGESILMYGPPGTGKSAVYEAATFPDREVAEDGTFVHAGMETVVCAVDTTEADFFGTYTQDPNTGIFVWSPGPLQRAVESGIPLFVDEVFLADTRVLSSTLYGLMDGRNVLRIPMNPTLAPIPVRKGFLVFGAGNPDVPGAHFSEALRDRFDHKIEVETDWDLARDLGVPKSLLNAARVLNEKRREHLISWSPQLRALLRFRDNKDAYGRDYAYAALLGTVADEDREQVGAVLAKHVPATKGVLPLAMGARYPT